MPAADPGSTGAPHPPPPARTGVAGAAGRARLANQGVRAEPDRMILVDDPRSRGRLRLLGYPDQSVATSWRHGFDVRVVCSRDAVALPLVRGGPKGRHVIGAVYGADGLLVPGSTRAKGNRAWSANPPSIALDPTPRRRRLEGRTFFGGHLRHAFGHLLLETLPRFWPSVDLGSFDRVLFYPTRADETATRPSFGPAELALLEALGADPAAAMVVGDQPLELEELTVASSSFVLQHGVDDAFVSAADRVAVALGRGPAERGRHVYLSRSHLPAAVRGAANESAVEALAVACGFEVVHPQEHPFAEQVRIVGAASTIAGCDGSALHLAAFAHPGTVLVSVDSRVVINQFMIDAVRELDAVHVLAVEAPLADRTSGWVADLDLVRRGFALAGFTETQTRSQTTPPAVAGRRVPSGLRALVRRARSSRADR